MKRVNYGFSETETGMVVNIPNVIINQFRLDELLHNLDGKYPFLRIRRNRANKVTINGYIPNGYAMKQALGLEQGSETDNLVGSFYKFQTLYRRAIILSKMDALHRELEYYDAREENDYADKQMEALMNITLETIESERNLCDNPADDELPF